MTIWVRLKSRQFGTARIKRMRDKIEEMCKDVIKIGHINNCPGLTPKTSCTCGYVEALRYLLNCRSLDNLIEHQNKFL